MSQFQQDGQIASILAAGRASPIRNAMASGLPDNSQVGQYVSYEDWLAQQQTPDQQTINLPSFTAQTPSISSATQPAAAPISQAAAPAPVAAPVVKKAKQTLSFGGGGSSTSPSSGPLWDVQGGGPLGGEANLEATGFD
jgi:hypothetical protein